MSEYPEKQQHYYHPYSRQMAVKVANIAKALMYGLRITVNGGDHIMDGGSEIARVATVTENNSVIGETLLGYWEGNLSILVSMAKQITDDEYTQMLSNMALNDLHWSGESADEISSAISLDVSEKSKPEVYIDGEKVEIVAINDNHNAVVTVGNGKQHVGILYETSTPKEVFEYIPEEVYMDGEQ